MKPGFLSFWSSIRVGLLMAVFVAGSAVAQDYGKMNLQDVVGDAQGKLQRGNYSGAIAPLEEAINRTESLTDPAKAEICQNCRFQLARCFIQLGDSPAAMPILEDYLKKEPRKQERMALRMIAQGLFETADWEQIQNVAGRLLNMPDLSQDDRLNANLMLGQALFQQGKWKECIAPLIYTADKSQDKETKQVTQIMIVRALVEDENWSELFAWIPRVYRTDAKYDITLNLTVMRAGKTRFKQDDMLNALLLYRMVLPREKLIEFSNGRIASLSRDLAADVKVGITEGERKSRLKTIDGIRKMVEELTNLPPYEDEVFFRIGKVYHEIKRYWEGYVLFDMLYEKDPKGDIGTASINELVAILYDLGEIDRAEARILDYLEQHPNGPAARVLIALMMRDNISKTEKNPEKVIGLRKYVDALPATTDEDELQLTADLHYMMAFGYFLTGQFENSAEQFEVVYQKYPESFAVADAYYYRGMTFMMRAEYQAAIDSFVTYQNKYPDGEHYSASTFRVAVCLYGLTKPIEAEAAFTEFIATYPEHEFVSEAYSMRGDIESAKDGQDNPETEDVDEYDPYTLDRALDDYRQAIDKSQTAAQASYAAFQAAKVYKLEYKWQEIIDLMNYYLSLKEGEADVAQAVFWIGQSQIRMDQVDAAVSAYVDAILTFGNDVAQEGVDKIIRELVSVAESRLTDEDREGLSLKIRLKLDSVDPSENTLALRLRIAMAYLAGEEALATLGAELLASQQDLKVVPPIGLALMCDAAVASGDVEQMDRLYEFFISSFEESESLWSAYRAKTYQLLATGNTDAVLEIIEEAQGLYGADKFMGWAQIIKADTLFKMKEYTAAEDAYNTIMGVREWQGPLYADAMYGMGECRLATGDLESAHNFFQRTYLLFKAYDGGKRAADGYLAAADCLIQLDRQADAVRTWQSMLEDEYVNTLPQAEVAKEMIKKHGGA